MSEMCLVWMHGSSILVTETTLRKLMLRPGQQITEEVFFNICKSHLSEVSLEIAERMAQ